MEIESQEQQEEFSLEQHMQEVLQEEQVNDTPDYLTEIPEEDRKYAKGWNPEFKGENAKTLKQFISDGKMMEKIEHLSKSNKSKDEELKRRLENQARFFQLQMAKQREELEEKFRDAVNMSDIEGVKRAQKEIDELDQLMEAEKKPEPITFDKLPSEERLLVAEWDAKNQWINAANPDHPGYDPRNTKAIAKAVLANSIIKKMAGQNKMPSEIIGEVERQIAENFPTETPRKQAPKTLPNTAMPGVSRGTRMISWGELDRNELAMWDQWGGKVWKTKEEFLQEVTDARIGDKK